MNDTSLDVGKKMLEVAIILPSLAIDMLMCNLGAGEDVVKAGMLVNRAMTLLSRNVIVSEECTKDIRESAFFIEAECIYKLYNLMLNDYDYALTNLDNFDGIRNSKSFVEQLKIVKSMIPSAIGDSKNV